MRSQATAAAELPAEPHTIATTKNTPPGWPKTNTQMGENAKASLLYLDLGQVILSFMHVWC